MPKKQAQRRIDKQNGAVSRTVTITSTGSVGGGLTAHGLDSSYHTGTLAESQAPWAATQVDLDAHIADTDLHHTRLHDVLGTDDHSITADAYALLGATSANTLGLLYIASSGDGIDVTKSGGIFTVAADVSDFAGEGLEDDGSNNLRVDEDYDFAWTGDHTYTGSLSSAPFDSADPIVGFRIQADGNAWFANLEATSLSIKTFISDVTLALAGSEVITKSKAILSRDFTTPVAAGTLYVYDLPGQPDTAVFESGDFVRLRYVNRATGLSVGDVWGTVSAYSDLADGEQSWTFTRTAGDAGQTIYEGMVALDYGASGDGYIELTSLGDDTPRISLRTWTSTPAVAGNHTTRAILGNLSGHTDAVYGALSGYGFFTDLAYLKGDLYAANGDTVINDNGLNIQAGSNSSVNWTGVGDKITFSTDPLDDQDESTIVAQQYAYRYDNSGTIVNFTEIATKSGIYTDADAAEAMLRATYESETFGVSSQWGYVDVSAGDSPVVDISAGDVWDSAAGEIKLNAPTTTLYGHLLVALDSTLDIGTSDNRVRRIYADEIIAGTTSSIDTGHNHDDRYYTKSQSDTALAGKSNTGHTHAGYVTSAALAAELADYVDDAALAIVLADYDTSAEVDAKLADLSSATHSHNLADLAERNYSSLQNRGHVLASTTGLGADHTVAGLTAGMVLVATGATTAAFQALDWDDLGDASHDINDGHTGDLEWDRLDKTGSDLADLEARAYGSLTERTHNIVGSDHSVTAAQYSVVGTPGAANTLAAWATDSDGTAGNVLLRSGDNGELSLGALTLTGDVTLPYWEIDSATGVMQTTGDYAFAPPSGTSGYQGIRFTPSDGAVEATYMSSTEFGAETLVFEQTAVNAGDLVIAKSGGKLRTAATFQLKHYLVDDNGDQIVDDLGNPIVMHDTAITATIQLDHPPEGEISLLRVGDQIIIAGKPQYQMWTYGSGLPFPPTRFYPAVTISGGLPVQLRCVVLSVDADDPNEYVVQVASDLPYEHLIFPVGSAVADYGQNGDAYIALRTRRKNAYMDIGTLPGTGWEYDTVPFIRLGDIGGLPNVADPGEVGLVGGDIANGVDAYFKLSDNGIVLHNGDHVITDSDGVRRVLMSTTGLNIKIYDDNQESPYDDIADLLSNDEIFRSAITWSDDVDSPSKTYAALYAYTDIYGLGSKWNLASLEAIRTADATRATASIKAGTAGVSASDYGPNAGYVNASAPTAITLYSNYININGNAQVAFSGSTVVMANLPTSSTGLVRGTLWNDSGTVKVVT